MNLSLTRSMIIMLVASLLVVAYGYLCRIFNLYFFWESKEIGWFLFGVAVIPCLLMIMKRKKLLGQKRWLEMAALFCTLLNLFFISMRFFTIPLTTGCAKAKAFVVASEAVHQQVGVIKGISMVPRGGVSFSSAEGKTGKEAIYHLIVKGEKRYVDVSLEMAKPDGADWQIGALTIAQ